MTFTRFFFRLWRLCVMAWIWSLPANAVGTWKPVTRSAPGPVSLMLLLSDGTVMAADSDTNSGWYRLTPDIHGNYVNGTWSRLASMHDTRHYYSSCVLKDGRVLVAGGEFGSGVAKSEIYNPLSNTWTQIVVPKSLLDPAKDSPEVGEKQGFYDSPCKILPNGNVIVAPVGASITGGSMIYNILSGSWTSGPKFFRVGYPDQGEASWVKLPDDSILTIDPASIHSERYIPAQNRWVNDATVPVPIYDTVGVEIGAAVLLPDGRAMFFGATGLPSSTRPRAPPPLVPGRLARTFPMDWWRPMRPLRCCPTARSFAPSVRHSSRMRWMWCSIRGRRRSTSSIP